MAKQTSLQGHGMAGRLRSFTAKTPSFALVPLESLVIPIGKGVSKTLAFSGNILPMSFSAVVPVSAPPGNIGIVFVQNGSWWLIYVWTGTAWVQIMDNGLQAQREIIPADETFVIPEDSQVVLFDSGLQVDGILKIDGRLILMESH